jgi:hypothetical protein
MTARYQPGILAARADIVAPPPQRACEDHNWGIPSGVYVAMALCFIGAIAVLAFSFHSGMAVSFGIIFAFLAAFFAIPAIFVRTSRARGGNAKAPSWYEFVDSGIVTATDRTKAGEAVTLVLMLPVLILGWAVAVAIIAAFV